MNAKATVLRNILSSDSLDFLMEAHNGLSARIVEEAGFKGIWASGLSISAALGVRDNNEASWTQILDVVEFMNDATSIPILLDGDTGYGNFNNFRRLVRKLDQRGIGGVCIEDKIFPKTNSFIDSKAQPLAGIEEFCGKIRAGKDSRISDDFCIVARIEALITGWGMDEALRRARAYTDAGADALLVHSRLDTADQVTEFMERWDRSCPVVIVPTTYSSVPTSVFANAGISVAIWANHLVRSSISAMQAAARQIHSEQSVATLEKDICSVQEIFRLQDADELKRAERMYLPRASSK